MTTKRFEVRWKINGNVEQQIFEDKAGSHAHAVDISKQHGSAQVGEIETSDEGTDVLLHAWVFTDGDLSNEEEFTMKTTKPKKTRAVSKGTAATTTTKKRAALLESGAKGDETRVAKAAAKKAAKTAKEAKPAKKAAKAKPAKAAAKTNGAAKQSRSPKNPSSHPVLAAFKAREGTNRAKLLLCLSKHIDKKVALTKVEQAVYGVVDHGQGKLAMVILGAQKSIKKDQLPYAIDIGRDEKKERFIELRSA
jgi:hypothetical protein